jgi:hypothetical protein
MTVYGSTTSSQDTQLTTKPLDEAPFETYLEILRDEGYEQEADESEVFYLEVLKQFDYTEEQIYKTSFKNLVKAVELILENAQREIELAVQTVTPLSQNMLLGEGAEKLTNEQLQQLMQRQMLLHEEEKTKQGWKKFV